VHPDGRLTLLGTTKRRGATTPDTKDLVIEKDGKYLYAIASGARAIAVFSIGRDGALTELPAGKSPVKLSAGQNILGLASN
jgi:6-phosphogluconolactonase (cycloisomerase 2 family)